MSWRLAPWCRKQVGVCCWCYSSVWPWSAKWWCRVTRGPELLVGPAKRRTKTRWSAWHTGSRSAPGSRKNHGGTAGPPWDTNIRPCWSRCCTIPSAVSPGGSAAISNLWPPAPVPCLSSGTPRPLSYIRLFNNNFNYENNLNFFWIVLTASHRQWTSLLIQWVHLQVHRAGECQWDSGNPKRRKWEPTLTVNEWSYRML